jgi:hypothetical protein
MTHSPSLKRRMSNYERDPEELRTMPERTVFVGGGGG